MLAAHGSDKPPPRRNRCTGGLMWGGNSFVNLSPMSDAPGQSMPVGGHLRQHVSDQRLLPYMDATFHDADKAVELYLWDRDLATAFFHDLSVLEVALRNTMDRALARRYGDEWFRMCSALFDRRTYDQIADACERLPSRSLNAAPADGKIRGRLIASCMFGTWVSALDAGGRTGAAAGPVRDGGPRRRVDAKRVAVRLSRRGARSLDRSVRSWTVSGFSRRFGKSTSCEIA